MEEMQSCCRANENETSSGMKGRMHHGRGARMIATAVLLGSLIIAGSIVFVGMPRTAKAPENAPTTDAAAAKAPSQPAKPVVTLDQVKGLFNGKNISFGKADSKLLFVEFSDPSCPYCHIAGGQNAALNKQAGAQFLMVKDGGTYLPAVPEIKKLVDAGKASFTWIYANGHGSGEMGTRAFYCANEKGKFWQVHDLLMSDAGFKLMNTDIKNDTTKSGALAEFLKSAVNPADMKSCLDSGKYDDRLTGDMAIAQQFGFSGTPSFFVNTTNFPGAVSFKDMQPVVDSALK